ncbi:hypothetical protein GOM44_06250 [Wolbachia endosymbiont of Atemnus politus]|nr:hypothetical protein [Wolbachia endosymbiont of Atemnus politus]
MHKNEEINGAETSGNVGETKVTVETIREEVKKEIAGLASKTNLNTKAYRKYVDEQLAEKAGASALIAKADKTALDEVQESLTSSNTNLGKKLNSSDLKEKVKTVLQNPEVTALLKEAISQVA